MQKRYRILEQLGAFYPQYQDSIWCKWFDVWEYCPDHRDWSFNDSVVRYDTLLGAREFINREIEHETKEKQKDTVIVHPYP